MKSIEFRDVTKSYDKNVVIRDLDLTIESGERVILLGPSGCGKTTTLRMISGLEDITSGDLYMGGKRVNEVESGDRNIAMVFQNYALFPHMTVFQNIAFGLRTYRLPKAEVKTRVAEMVHTLELDGLEERLPRQLSGGQRQRVALARAAVKKADYFLLDEPLSNLDAQLRVQARKELVRLHEMYRPTFVYVTHDQIEAMTIGQKVVLMYKGEVQMCASPYDIYYRPANTFTAKFIGSPPMNLVPARLEGRELVLGEQRLPLAEPWLRQLESRQGGEVILGVRPENIILAENPGEGGLPVMVRYVENYGSKLGVYFDLGGVECIASQEQEVDAWPGRKMWWRPVYEKLHFFQPETEKNLGYPQEYDTKKSGPLDDAGALLGREG